MTIVVLAGCNGGRGEAAEPGGTSDAAAPADAMPYDLGSPAAVTELPDALREISGIASIGPNVVAAVQDEEGIIYSVDVATGRVLTQLQFAGKGDYEDIAPAGGSLYVLRSDGVLFEVKEGWRDGNATVEEHDTGLGGKCDAEGLTLDAPANRLLIACKEEPKGVKRARAIFGFDLGTKRLAPEPAFLLQPDSLEALAGPGAKVKDFKPAAIAQNPDTGELYVLSSVEKALVVVNDSGTPTSWIGLDGAMYAQPEGMAFVAGGGLLISNEGPDEAATILQFKMDPSRSPSD